MNIPTSVLLDEAEISMIFSMLNNKMSGPVIKMIELIDYDQCTGQRNHLIHINQWFRQLESEPLIKLTCMIDYGQFKN